MNLLLVAIVGICVISALGALGSMLLTALSLEDEDDIN